MKPWLWRFVALVGIIGVLFSLFSDMLFVDKIGDQGFTAVVADPDHSLTSYRVTNVKPKAPAARVLAPGDRFELVDTRLGERLRYSKADPGDVFHLRRERRGTTQIVDLTIDRNSGASSAIVYVYAFLRLAMGVVAAVIIFRRPDLPEARALASFFILFALALASSLGNLFNGIGVLVYVILNQALAFAAFGQAIRFATIFPVRTEIGTRALIRRANPAIVWAIIALLVYVEISIIVYLRMPPAWVMTLAKFPWLYFLVASTTAFTIGTMRATAEEKHRVRWVSYSIAIGFSGLIAEIVALLTRTNDDWVYLLPLTLLAIPFGTGYAILRYRVLDIGFVVNRAIVFGGVSIVVVLALGILEWFLGRYLVDVSHTTSSVIELALSLALGLSLKSIHHRVDRFVDDVFFRQRHEAEAALRRFAQEASFITAIDVLETRAIEAVVRHTGSLGAAIYLAEPQRFVCVAATDDRAATVDENDPALVRMRTFREPFVLEGTATALPGERAFPFIVRGHLTGMLVLSQKAAGEAYAPDETSALASLASAVGVALDVLQTEFLKREVERVLRGDLSLEGLRLAWDRTAATSGAIPASEGILLVTAPPP